VSVEDLKFVGWWLLAIALIVLGFVGTVAPGLPGVLLIYGGMWLGAWIDDFTKIGWPTLTVLGVLTAASFIADFLSSVLGAKRVGASKQALIGSVIGGFAGIPFGLPGIIAGPFVGAVAGEYLAQQKLQVAARVGWGTFVGLAVGTLAKIALAVAMIGVFTAGYLL
jgi:uncharacterized protein YqgC (DUF456 family)